MYTVVIFRSRNDALAVGDYLRKQGVSASLIDAPRQLSASCGLALRIYNSAPTIIKNLLINGKKISLITGIYEELGTGNKKIYNRI